ncbi:hypothetical protein JKP88DRAFT_282692 [Tribonema minus]|uniref:Uncharacterized protein n=1 Tax=Tribonema minus TaxID=303371 RepID=A0A835YJT8_9STRA|nr:hypothetical protein JKP88DRAFT_282692 [Tribonema minus]
MDVDMSALEEPLSAPGRHVEVSYRARRDGFGGYAQLSIATSYAGGQAAMQRQRLEGMGGAVMKRACVGSYAVQQREVAALRCLLPAEAWACCNTVSDVAAEHIPVTVHLYGNGRHGDCSLLDDSVVSSATPAGVISQLLRRQVVSLVAEGCLTSLAIHISCVKGSSGDDADDIWHARQAALIAAAPPTLASLVLDCFSLESLPQPLQLPPHLRELTLLEYRGKAKCFVRDLGDTIMPRSLNTLTLEAYTIGPGLQLPRDLRTLRLVRCSLLWRDDVIAGRRITQFSSFPDSLVTLELELLNSADDRLEHPLLTLPPNLQHLRITCEEESDTRIMFHGPLGPLPPSLRTLLIDHHYGCMALPPLPPGLREVTLGEYEHALPAPLPPCLEALELRDCRKRQRLREALASTDSSRLQRLTLVQKSAGGSLCSAIGPLPAALTHFTCWLNGSGDKDEDEPEDEDEDGDGRNAQLPPLPQGLQELRVNGVALPAALPASLRLVRLGTDVDMSVLEEPLQMPGRRIEVECATHSG